MRELAEIPHLCYLIICVLTKSHKVTNANQQLKVKTHDMEPTISFTTTSQHNTCNKYSWHPPLILWSFLLSHMSKTLKTCYSLSRWWTNQKTLHFQVLMLILTHHTQLEDGPALKKNVQLARRMALSAKSDPSLIQIWLRRVPSCPNVSQSGVKSALVLSLQRPSHKADTSQNLCAQSLVFYKTTNDMLWESKQICITSKLFWGVVFPPKKYKNPPLIGLGLCWVLCQSYYIGGVLVKCLNRLNFRCPYAITN